MTDTPRVAVIGLDCVPPQLLFRDFEADTPNIHALMQRGMWGDLASITPPITVPAWACAMTGKTPGQLGIYGFRNRKDTSYDGLSIATSDAIREPAVWDALGAEGLRSLLIGVPPSFPPPEAFPGWRVGCFLTPPSATSWAFPAELETEIVGELGDGQRLHLRHRGLPSGRVRRGARPGLQDDRAPLPGRPQARGREAVGLLHAVRDRAGSPASRLLETLGPATPAVRGGEQVRDGVPGLLPVPRRRGRQAARGPTRRCDHDRDERSRRPADDGWVLLQRLARPGGVSRARCTTVARHADQGCRDRLEPDRRLGRRRLLRTAVPEREGARARGHRRTRPLRGGPGRADRPARGRARARRDAARHDRAEASGRLPGGPRRRAGPDRVLRRPRLAFGRVGGEPEHLHVRERHRPRRGQPRPSGRVGDGRSARSADGRGDRAQPRRRRPVHPVDVRHRRRPRAPSEGASCDASPRAEGLHRLVHRPVRGRQVDDRRDAVSTSSRRGG